MQATHLIRYFFSDFQRKEQLLQAQEEMRRQQAIELRKRRLREETERRKLAIQDQKRRAQEKKERNEIAATISAVTAARELQDHAAHAHAGGRGRTIHGYEAEITTGSRAEARATTHERLLREAMNVIHDESRSQSRNVGRPWSGEPAPPSPGTPHHGNVHFQPPSPADSLADSPTDSLVGSPGVGPAVEVRHGGVAPGWHGVTRAPSLPPPIAAHPRQEHADMQPSALASRLPQPRRAAPGPALRGPQAADGDTSAGPSGGSRAPASAPRGLIRPPSDRQADGDGAPSEAGPAWAAGLGHGQGWTRHRDADYGWGAAAVPPDHTAAAPPHVRVRMVAGLATAGDRELSHEGDLDSRHMEKRNIGAPSWPTRGRGDGLEKTPTEADIDRLWVAVRQQLAGDMHEPASQLHAHAVDSHGDHRHVRGLSEDHSRGQGQGQGHSQGPRVSRTRGADSALARARAAAVNHGALDFSPDTLCGSIICFIELMSHQAPLGIEVGGWVGGIFFIINSLFVFYVCRPHVCFMVHRCELTARRPRF